MFMISVENENNLIQSSKNILIFSMKSKRKKMDSIFPADNYQPSHNFIYIKHTFYYLRTV